MKKNIIMIVYNDLKMDSRVQRSAETLSKLGNLIVIHIGKDFYEQDSYETINLKIKGNKNITKYLSFVKGVISYIKNSNKKIDLFYAHDFFSALPLIVIKVLRKSKKFVYDAHELYIPNKKENFSLRDYFFYLMEKLAIKMSNLIICAQNQRANIMKYKYKLKNKPIVIRNISLLPKMDNNLDELNIGIDKFLDKSNINIVYSGVVSKERNLIKVIEAVNCLDDNYKLLLIGYGDGVKELVERINSLKNNNIMYLGKIEYNKMSNILKKCDIGIISYPMNGLNNIYCAPNKIFEYASVNLPMVSFYNPTIYEEFKKYNIGCCDDDIKSSIIKVAQNIELYRSNLEIFLKKNSWEKESRILYDNIKKIL